MSRKTVETEGNGDDTVRLLPPEPTTVNGVSDGTDGNEDPDAQETTPLLQRPTSDTEQNASSRTPRKSWWTIISIAILLVITINIIVFAFVIPSAAQTYATQAATYSLQNIEVQNFTDDGVIAKAQVNVTVDASRVPSKGIRNLGLFTTNLFKHVYTQPCLVAVLLPQYNGAQVALVALPALEFDVRNKHVNILDIISNVTITDNSLAVQLAGDFLAGRRQQIETIGETDVHIKAGIIPLGRHHVRQQVIIQGNAPTLPEFTVNRLNVVDQPGEGTLMTASADIVNPYPVTLDVPALEWKVSVPGCTPFDRIRLTNANTGPLSIRAGKNITVDLSSSISSLPQDLLDPCKDAAPSPLEALFQALLDPKRNTTVFISGASHAISLPKWLPDILSSLTIPIPIPNLDSNTTDLISSIHCSEMKVTFPSPWAPPGTPNAQPKVSGLIEAIIRPPKEAENVGVNVTAVKADVYLYDQGTKFGRILVPEWSPATTERKVKIHVKVRVAEVPVEVLDPIVFQRVMTKILQGDGTVEIGVEGTVDAQVSVLVGDFAVRGIPVKGLVEVEGIHPFDDLKTSLVGDIEVISTTRNSITLSSTVKVKNPTEYEAVIPYLDLELLYEGHLIGNATALNTTISKGTNEISGTIRYAPSTPDDIPYGEKFLGQYLSGRMPNITARFHNASIQGNPALSRALAGLNITIPVPPIHHRHNEEPHESKTSSPFLRCATIHVLSRTAQFELFNPLSNSGITINSLDANATYEGEIIGTITEPTFNFEVQAGREGDTTTDKIPVEVGSVGYDVIRRALGGELIVDAVADVVATIGKWRGRIRYHGEGVGAKVRL